MANESIKKYRPSLTAAQITCILQALRQTEQTSIVQSTSNALRVFGFKIESGIKTVGYETTQAPENIESVLGIVSHETESHYIYANLSPRAKRQLAYEKWRANPLSCNQDEIEYALTYGYEYHLLSEAEFVDFVTRSFDTSKEEALIEYRAGQLTKGEPE